ncbi:hypothetical protein AGRA3207_002884 [Actinomadura graeca]|uniref:Uncharacterized protein n=1 Tax=Actinomadura graeca TaxID=2750812 RepID=A0ABX8QT10_9ACTN|nr:hypothetical protein [Actinomadura graeca]QXJ21966.1 hypothetical protein AGRA3207_002884 [Actinomadura graeca]
MSDRFDGTEHRHAYPKLHDLMGTLQGRRFAVHLRASPLAIIVTRPDDPTDARQTVTCKPRATDQDRMWFYDDANGEPIAEAEDIIGAAVIIAGNLTPTP